MKGREEGREGLSWGMGRPHAPKVQVAIKQAISKQRSNGSRFCEQLRWLTLTNLPQFPGAWLSTVYSAAVPRVTSPLAPAFSSGRPSTTPPRAAGFFNQLQVSGITNGAIAAISHFVPGPCGVRRVFLERIYLEVAVVQ